MLASNKLSRYALSHALRSAKCNSCRALSVFQTAMPPPLRQPRDLTKTEMAFDTWIDAKCSTGEIWIHPDVIVGKDAGGGYGLFATRDIPCNAQTELMRVTLPRFSAAVAEHSCYAGNPEFYDSIKQLVLTSIAPKAQLQQQQNLVSSICLALQILVLSDSEADADLRPYYDLLKSSSYPYNTSTLPHPLCLDHEYEASLAQAKAGGSHLREFDPGLDATGAKMVSLLGWLEGTPLHRALHVRKRLYNLVAKGLFRGNDMHKTNFDYAMGVVLSRALSGVMPEIGAEARGKRENTGMCEVPLTLVPMLDFANHAADPSAFISYNGHKHEFVLKPLLLPMMMIEEEAGKGKNVISAGDEITISYGEERDSLSFLSLYGFCPRASKYNGFLFSFNIADKLLLKLTLPTRQRIIASSAEDLRHEKDAVPDVSLQIPLVVLFSEDVEAVWDTQKSAVQRVALFEKTLGKHVQGYLAAAQAQDAMVQNRENGAGGGGESSIAATTTAASIGGGGSSTSNNTASTGGRGSTHMNHITDLIALIRQEIKQLHDTRFHARENGEYLCKTVTEEKFIEDCQYYVETQTQAAKVLLQAVQGYRQAVEAVLEKTQRPRTQGTRSAR